MTEKSWKLDGFKDEASVQGYVPGGQDMFLSELFVYDDGVTLAAPYNGINCWVVYQIPKFSGELPRDD